MNFGPRIVLGWRFVSLSRGARSESLNARYKFRERKRFDEIVVSALLKPCNSIIHGMLCTQDDYRKPYALCPYPFDDGKSIQVGVTSVHYRQIVSRCGKKMKGVFPVRGVIYDKPSPGESVLYELRNFGIVFD